jgi:hypothetical protein
VNKKTHPAISPAEILAAHEAVIQAAGTRFFVTLGTELDAIRKDGSYKAGHRTFNDYCRARWGFSDSRARQLIRAAKSVTSGNASGAKNEREVRRMLAEEPERKALPPGPPPPTQTVEEVEERLNRIERELAALQAWQDISRDLRIETYPPRVRAWAAMQSLRPLIEAGAFDPRGKIYEQTLGARDREARKLAVLNLQLEILDQADRIRRDHEAAIKREVWERTATPEQIAKRDERQARNRARKERK